MLAKGPKISISRRETVSYWISLLVMKYMIKVLSSRFHHCFGLFNMLAVDGCNKTMLSRDLSNHVLCSVSIHKPWGSCFFRKCSQRNRNFRNVEKDWQKINLSEISAFELVMVNSSYHKKNWLSSVIDVLTNSPQISDINKRDIFQLNFWKRE